jgi:signal transduction histidine kinase
MATVLPSPSARLRYPGAATLAWALAAVFALAALVLGGRGSGQDLTSDIAVAIGFLLATIFALNRHRKNRSRHNRLLALAFSLPTMGMISYVMGYGDPAIAAYTPVDIFFLAAYLVIGIALVAMPKPPSRPGTRLLMWLSGAIGGVTLAAVLGITFGVRLANDLDGVDISDASVSIVYLVVDIATISLTAAVLIRRSMIRMDPRTAALMIGLTAIATNDIMYTLSVTNEQAEPAYGPILIGVGALIFVSLYPDRVDAQEEVLARHLPFWLLLLPFVLVGTLGAVLIGAHIFGQHDRADLAGVAMLVVAFLVMGQQLHLLLLERREVSKIRSNLVAAVSHEVRTPLSAVVASLELLASHTLTPEETEELTILGREQADHLRRMMEDLVDLSRGTLEARTLNEATVPVGDLVVEAMRRSGAVDVDVAVPPDVMLTADVERLAQALGEYLENAVRFGAGAVMVVATERGGDVRIEVHDDGPGVPERYLQVIWDPFERGGRRLDSRIQGAGLGLAVAAAVAKAHGGQAAYKSSELLGGSAFVIELPGRGFRRVTRSVGSGSAVL